MGKAAEDAGRCGMDEGVMPLPPVVGDECLPAIGCCGWVPRVALRGPSSVLRGSSTSERR
jgi:hypothetical protein